MSWNTDKTRVLLFCLSLLGMILAWLCSNVYADVKDNISRIITLEANDKNNHEILIEVREDVKYLRDHLVP